jgi:hypothetical protein
MGAHRRSRYPGRMHVARYAVLAVGCLAAVPTAQQPETLRVIGIVEVPGVLPAGAPADGAPLVRPDGPVLLRSRPSSDSPPVTTIRSADALDVAEFAYEALGAVVYRREQDWSLIRTSAGVAGWLAPADAGPFHPLEALLGEGLLYLTEAWNGRIAASPEARDSVPVPGDPLRRIAGYLVPVLQEVRVILEPGQELEEVRSRYRASAIRSRPGPDGSRILDVETGTPVDAFQRPDRLSPVAVRFETNRSGAALRTLNGIPHEVLVFDTRPGWFEVALRRENRREEPRVWLEDAAVWRFHPVTDEAEQTRLADRAWGPEVRAARAVEFRQVGDRLWIEVEVLSHSICESTEEPTVTARGWIPAHAESGAANIWFFSRGC